MNRALAGEKRRLSATLAELARLKHGIEQLDDEPTGAPAPPTSAAEALRQVTGEGRRARAARPRERARRGAATPRGRGPPRGGRARRSLLRHRPPARAGAPAGGSGPGRAPARLRRPARRRPLLLSRGARPALLRHRLQAAPLGAALVPGAGEGGLAPRGAGAGRRRHRRRARRRSPRDPGLHRQRAAPPRRLCRSRRRGPPARPGLAGARGAGRGVQSGLPAVPAARDAVARGGGTGAAPAGRAAPGDARGRGGGHGRRPRHTLRGRGGLRLAGGVSQARGEPRRAHLGLVGAAQRRGVVPARQRGRAERAHAGLRPRRGLGARGVAPRRPAPGPQPHARGPRPHRRPRIVRRLVAPSARDPRQPGGGHDPAHQGQGAAAPARGARRPDRPVQPAGIQRAARLRDRQRGPAHERRPRPRDPRPRPLQEAQRHLRAPRGRRRAALARAPPQPAPPQGRPGGALRGRGVRGDPPRLRRRALDGRGRASAQRAPEAPLRVRGRAHPPLTASFGVAIWPADGKEPEALLSASDRALYAAKQTGRNRVVAASSISPPATGAS